jgi:hypothetical protein
LAVFISKAKALAYLEAKADGRPILSAKMLQLVRITLATTAANQAAMTAG